MNKYLMSASGSPCIALVIALLFSLSSFGQYKVNENVAPRSIDYPVCTWSPEPGNSNFTSVENPYLTNRIEANDTPCATFDVNYAGFSPEAEAAFEYALNIWALSIESSIPIRVTASLEPLAPGTLGSAAPTNAWQLNDGMGGPTYWFPQALAEKLVGEDLSDLPFPPVEGSVDIQCQFNENINWYFGTDANPAANEFDFVTVVLHELGHGLGFSGLFVGLNNEGDQGQIRANGIPSIYSAFIENGNGVSILDFDDPSEDLKNEFESGNLFSNSPSATDLNGGDIPKIYAPSTWNQGSSFSHWDLATFSGTENALMRPSLPNGVALHNPGPITIGFFEDMGWSVCASLSTPEFANNSVFISPVPFDNQLLIQLPPEASFNTIDLSIYNLSGQLVFQKQTTASNGAIELSGLEKLEAAIYFIQITSEYGDLSMTKKIIKR